MAFDLKEIIASRLGENYQLHERHINRTLVAAQRVIGFDKVYARAEGAYLFDMDNQPYLDFLSGYRDLRSEGESLKFCSSWLSI